MIRMKAIRNLTYRTRRLLADGTSEQTSSLKPGDVFEVMKPRDLKLLRATRKAEPLREPVTIAPPSPAVAAKIAAATAPTPVGAMTNPQTSPPDDIAAVRAEYVAAVGRNPFMGWDIATLREKIAAAKAES